MSAVHVGEARKHDRIKAINRQVASLDQQIARGAIGAGGMIVQQLAEHVEFCKTEKARLLAEVTRLSELGPGQLIAELVPEVARERATQEAIEAGAPTDIRDVLARGGRQPDQVVVSNHPRPVRREGGEPGPVSPGLITIDGRPISPNKVLTYDANGHLVSLD